MKGSRLYMLLLGVFLLFVFVTEYLSPHEFSWKPTFDRNDREPFGSYVFDDVAASSVESYTVTDKSFFQFAQEDSASPPRAFLLTEDEVRFGPADVESLYKLLHAGNQVMICAKYFPQALEDTLRFETEYGSYLPDMKQYVYDSARQRDSIFFGANPCNPTHIYEVYPQLHPVYFAEKKMRDSSETLVWDKNKRPLAKRVFIGKGELFLVSTPLMFTNYGILDGRNASYAFRLLSCMKGKPLVRTEAYGSHAGKAGTPLRYVLSEPPLRWAVYSTLVLLILFMIFTAKRRQRVIPVVETPPNRTLGFMQLISNLYYQKHENGEILKMKNLYFCDSVKRLTGIDLQDGVPDEATFMRLSEKTGISRDVLRTLIKDINIAIYRSEAPDALLKTYVDGMNGILHSLKMT
ncbi:MAG: DUF4350 domain-containing protein [Tannerella sp.]|jgi:hypothetical protein|nr:DUF4350 domain-containing protein [Tannerella sp.]